MQYYPPLFYQVACENGFGDILFVLNVPHLKSIDCTFSGKTQEQSVDENILNLHKSVMHEYFEVQKRLNMTTLLKNMNQKGRLGCNFLGHVDHSYTEEALTRPGKPSNTPTIPLQGGVRRIVSLSQKVEYPGDPTSLSMMLSRPEEYDVTGTDMYGWTALHKFAAWDKVDLLRLLVPHINDADLNSVAGPEKGTCLHACVDMGARHSLCFLLSLNKINRLIVNKNNLTALDLADSKELHEISGLLKAL